MTRYTISQLLADAKSVGTENKQEMAAKYSIDSKKTKEIRHHILGMAVDMVRSKKGAYTVDDYKAWDRYYDVPASAAKIRLAMDTMPMEFVVAFVNDLRKTTRPTSYFGEKILPMYEKYMYARMENEDAEIIKIMGILNEQTADFHRHYLETALEGSRDVFNHYVQYKEIRSLMAAYNFFAVKPTDGKEKHHHVARIFEHIYRMRVESNDFNLDHWLQVETERINKEFTKAMRLIATRVKKAAMDADSLKVNTIYAYDAKAFDIHVSDNTRTMHARSIWCAELSMIVTPHWRFIITNA